MEKTTTTLENIIKAQKSRIGKADGATDLGAYWLAFDHYLSRWGEAFRGAPPLCDLSLQARHFRSGVVQLGLHYDEWNQVRQTENTWWYPLAIAGMTTVEDVIVAIKRAGVALEDLGGRPAIDEEHRDALEKELLGLGLELYPDDFV